MQRRSFLSTFTGVLSFGAFERSVMAEAGVRSPLEIGGSSTTRDVWLVRCVNQDLLASRLNDTDCQATCQDLAALWKSCLEVVAVAPTEESARGLVQSLSCGYVRSYGLHDALWLGWFEGPYWPMLQSREALLESDQIYDAHDLERVAPKWLESLLTLAKLKESLVFLLREKYPEKTEYAKLAKRELLGPDFDPDCECPAIGEVLDDAVIAFDSTRLRQQLSDADLYRLLEDFAFPPATSEKLTIRLEATQSLSEQLNAVPDGCDQHKYVDLSGEAPAQQDHSDVLQQRWQKTKLNYQRILVKELASVKESADE